MFLCHESGRRLYGSDSVDRLCVNKRQVDSSDVPVSRVWEAAIRLRQCRQTVCEQGSNLGVCSPPSYMPDNIMLKLRYTETSRFIRCSCVTSLGGGYTAQTV
ncbi:hypothetical protein J6590_070556 [Homalodisca vitripennis]|nr:hypothetical protein J6590_070556 [Homalodisca vitripennis]